MPFYEELGRRTPPPPPYSLGKRDSDTPKSASEPSQRLDPPPPPPYLISTQRKDPVIASLDDPLAQIMASHDSDLPSYGNTASLPPIRSQCPTTQTLGTGNDFAERRRCECILSGMPVEPELILGFHGRPFRPLENVPLETGTHSMPPNFVFNESIKSGPDRDVLTSQSPSTVPSMVPLSLNSSFPTQPPPHTLVTMAQEPLHTLRRESRMDSAASAILMAAQAPASFEPFGCTYLLPALPSQQAPAKCAMLTALASW